ncbi:hypothetical protein R1sor_001649 [Riccia sorocarpa]|uniref:glucan endo-1,3-beta-D-glucosidase n=1 Tax=Riccia sorocarpa TaxID=122646 RepID=A0ABD3GWJ2_9MARC
MLTTGFIPLLVLYKMAHPHLFGGHHSPGDNTACIDAKEHTGHKKCPLPVALPPRPSRSECELRSDVLCYGNFTIDYFPTYVGVNYGRIADNLPDPKTVAQFIVKQRIGKVKIYDSDPAVLQAFAHTGVKVIIGLPNEDLHTMATDTGAAYNWVAKNVAAYVPATLITAIAVGNEILSTMPDLAGDLLGAMNNLHSALVNLKLDGYVKVSTPHSLSILSTSYPPSQGRFNQMWVDSVIHPMLNFLVTTRSHIMVNVYPFFAYEGNPAEVALNYALFQPTNNVQDPVTNLQYNSLFDAQVDAVYSAITALDSQFQNLPIVVTETGWPSQGDQNEVGSSIQNAAMYNGNLVRHILSGRGTPLRPGKPIDTYLFALFNENKKPGPLSERNYGLFYPDMKPVYTLNFTTGDHGSPGNSRGPPKRGAPSGGQFCVAKDDVSDSQLQAALDYACGPGGADCKPIQPGQACFEPNNLHAHASYAFNSYFQMNNQKEGTCYFSGAAVVKSGNPSTNSCNWPTR